eukprot:659329-Pelagomonas_calceolata.AAC.1
MLPCGLQRRMLFQLIFLKGFLGVTRTTTNWAVLKECWHQSQQYHRFRAAVKLCNSMLGTALVIAFTPCYASRFEVKSKDGKCWTAQLIRAFQDLRSVDIFQQAVRSEEADSVKTAINYSFASLPPTKLGLLLLLLATLAYVPLPWYLFLALPEQVVRNMSRFPLCAHALKVKLAVSQDGVICV